MHATAFKKIQKEELIVYKEILEFYNDQGKLGICKKAIMWRTIYALRDMILNPSLFDEFKKCCPDKKDYIWGCPYLGFKLKVLAWLITHTCEPIAKAITRLRKLLGR